MSKPWTDEEIMLDLLEKINLRLGRGSWYFTPEQVPHVGWVIRGDNPMKDQHLSFAPPLLLIREAVDPSYHIQRCYQDILRLMRQAGPTTRADHDDMWPEQKT